MWLSINCHLTASKTSHGYNLVDIAQQMTCRFVVSKHEWLCLLAMLGRAWACCFSRTLWHLKEKKKNMWLFSLCSSLVLIFSWSCNIMMLLSFFCQLHHFIGLFLGNLYASDLFSLFEWNVFICKFRRV